MKRRIFSLLLCIILVFSCLIIPSNAMGVDVDLNFDAVEFFDWLVSSNWQTIHGVQSFFMKDICSYSPKPDGLHNFKEQRTTVNGKTTLYYICEYCGKSAGEVGEEAYQQQVEELPATGYTSSGSLIWRPTVSDLYNGEVIVNNSSYSLPFSLSQYVFVGNSSGNGFNVSVNLTFNASSGNIWAFLPRFVAPIRGTYFCLAGPCSQTVAYSLSGIRKDHSTSYVAGIVGYHVSGDKVESSSVSFMPILEWTASAVVKVLFPTYEIVPDNAVSGDTYSVNTRPTSIVGGNYGIVGDNGTINTITNNNQIINETNNTYYNPATGQTATIADWSYDYSSRAYTLTLDTGDKVSVEYGDENITITENTVNEGDTIVNNYTIYYMIDGSGCSHDWQQGEAAAPTCISPGKTPYTCSKCGQTRNEITPALGHDWEVLRTVLTEYDEDGNLTQQGYTLYKCTRCGEQYKDVDETGPPAPPGGDDGGLIEFLNGLIKSLSDNLSGVVALLRRFFSEIPGLFQGFLGFLSAMFSFLPDEIMLLLTFGMAAVVVIGVIKAVRR